MSDMRFDRAMSDAEGLMWRLEKDPHLSSTFGTVTILDRAPDFDAFRRRMERATIGVPRLRQRVLPAPANLSPPMWVDDHDFSIDRHVRRIACPKPGTLRQVLDLASLIVADPFDKRNAFAVFIVQAVIVPFFRGWGGPSSACPVARPRPHKRDSRGTGLFRQHARPAADRGGVAGGAATGAGCW